MLQEDGYDGLDRTNRRYTAAMNLNYIPELDVSKELNSELATRYMQLIGFLRWVIELGCNDIYTEVSILSQYSALPRKGRIDALYGIFAYMRKKMKTCITFDPD